MITYNHLRFIFKSKYIEPQRGIYEYKILMICMPEKIVFNYTDDKRACPPVNFVTFANSL